MFPPPSHSYYRITEKSIAVDQVPRQSYFFNPSFEHPRPRQPQCSATPTLHPVSKRPTHPQPQHDSVNLTPLALYAGQKLLARKRLRSMHSCFVIPKSDLLPRLGKRHTYNTTAPPLIYPFHQPQYLNTQLHPMTARHLLLTTRPYPRLATVRQFQPQIYCSCIMRA